MVTAANKASTMWKGLRTGVLFARTAGMGERRAFEQRQGLKVKELYRYDPDSNEFQLVPKLGFTIMR